MRGGEEGKEGGEKARRGRHKRDEEGVLGAKQPGQTQAKTQMAYSLLERRWLIRYSRPGGAGVTETAIGSATYMSLAEAREAAFEFKRNLAKGILPVRKATFAAVAVDVLEAKLRVKKSARFKSGSQTARHWVKWLTYCKPLDHLKAPATATAT